MWIYLGGKLEMNQVQERLLGLLSDFAKCLLCVPHKECSLDTSYSLSKSIVSAKHTFYGY